MVIFNQDLQDGKLTSDSGRIVIYRDCIDYSIGQSRDHNDILRALSTRYRLPREELMSNAIRLYYKYFRRDIIVCPVRKIDKVEFERHQQYYERLILKKLR